MVLRLFRFWMGRGEDRLSARWGGNRDHPALPEEPVIAELVEAYRVGTTRTLLERTPLLPPASRALIA